MSLVNVRVTSLVMTSARRTFAVGLAIVRHTIHGGDEVSIDFTMVITSVRNATEVDTCKNHLAHQYNVYTVT